jgi:hypothetical protein
LVLVENQPKVKEWSLKRTILKEEDRSERE